MARWEPDAAARLEAAALELFAQHGYAATTVPSIAARAGLTTRSFFRHFADKREVLFIHEADFPGVVSSAISAQPEGLGAVDLVIRALEFVTTDRFSDWRDVLISRRAIVREDASLRERELLKFAILGESIRRSLVDRGIDDSTAALLAPIAVTVFDQSMNRWLDGDGSVPLVSIVRDTHAVLLAAFEVPANK